MQVNDGSIYLYGMTLVTTCHRLAGDFPKADGYGEIVESHRVPGGESGTCAVVLSALGVRVELDGNFQGRSTYPELSRFFDTSRVSLEHVTHDPSFDGLEDLVFVDGQTRTAFGRFREFYQEGAPDRWNSPSEEAIARARVAGVDPFFGEESLRAGQLCEAKGVKFVTIDCPHASDIHRRSDVNVLSSSFLRQHYPDTDPGTLFDEYTRTTDGLVVFTHGADDLWFGRAGGRDARFTPYRVGVESTLGAGDSFKAGAIYALSRGFDDATLIRFASATAAAACTRFPIAHDPPTMARISEIAGERF